MFRHQGKTRTLKHNLEIASLLSFVAGIVNVAGFLSVQQLTTNVTGHFAYFMDQVLHLHFWEGFVYFLYIFFFFLGSFFAGLMVEFRLRYGDKSIYILPAFFESLILGVIAFAGPAELQINPDLLACSLLFAMGLQNSFVTTISNATVRTTHLTGLFTDLGIELSQLFFYSQEEKRKKLVSSVKLRITIIGFFFLGGIFGGLVYTSIQLRVLLIAALLLFAGIFYDSVRIGIYRLKKRVYRH
jgi:uncharacterized membrane protein YoaK (UPF0700 family)